MSTTDMIRRDFPDAEEGLHKNLKKTFSSIKAFLDGACVNFSMKFVGIDWCRDFQRRVLLKTMRIPRGSVISYGKLAKMISAPGAARPMTRAPATYSKTLKSESPGGCVLDSGSEASDSETK